MTLQPGSTKEAGRIKPGTREKKQTVVKAKNVLVTQAHSSQWFKVHF